MRIGGYQKLSLIDYPGKIATTVFTVGCSFRCPFCHNPELIGVAPSLAEDSMEEEFFSFLDKRRGKLEGVCITGGEPTIQADLVDFIKRVKKAGFLVKLDTNGSRPDVLRDLLRQGIVDFVAMDIKSSPVGYSLAAGIDVDFERIKLSIDLIMQSKLDYEFRTTVVPGLHTEEDFVEIAKLIKGAKSYYLQVYRDIKILDNKLRKKTLGQTIDLEKIHKNIQKNFKKSGVRG